MREFLRRLASDRTHPLGAGIVLVEEEVGPELWPVDIEKHRFIVQIDPSDDTTALARRRGGSVLASVYEIGFGQVAAAACDFMGGVILSRGAGRHTQAIRLPQHPPHERAVAGPPAGTTVALALSSQRRLHDATVNMYLGHASRIALTTRRAPKLARHKHLNVVSAGGGMGPVLWRSGPSTPASNARRASSCSTRFQACGWPTESAQRCSTWTRTTKASRSGSGRIVGLRRSSPLTAGRGPRRWKNTGSALSWRPHGSLLARSRPRFPRVGRRGKEMLPSAVPAG